MEKNEIKALLEAKYNVLYETRYKNYAYRYKLDTGTTVYCGDSGAIWCEGKDKNKVQEYINKHYKGSPNRNVFIVYGHDAESKKEISLLLKDWKLNPLYLDELPTSGNTIIEQLEKYIPDVNYGIVLMTPDDVGASKENLLKQRFRARQNVIFEMGMLFSKLGRSRVSILLKENEDFELPSDINGVLYLSYKDNVREISEKLKKNLNQKGYDIA